MPRRWAGEAIQRYMDRRIQVSPAFNYDETRGFVPTADTQRVVSYISEKAGVPLDIRAANSVDAANGRPLWGSGGGVADFGGVGVVDPFEGSTHVVAHEGMHAVSPHPSTMQGSRQEVRPLPGGPGFRQAYELLSKPRVREEAHAQGGARATLNALGIASPDSDWRSPIDYPMTEAGHAAPIFFGYVKRQPDAGERREMDVIGRGLEPFAARMFQQGYGRMR